VWLDSPMYPYSSFGKIVNKFIGINTLNNTSGYLYQPVILISDPSCDTSFYKNADVVLGGLTNMFLFNTFTFGNTHYLQGVNATLYALDGSVQETYYI
jgi:hypothetical protein